jgi:diaminopimelate decarboxylase
VNEEQLEYDIVGPICESSDVFRKSYSIEKLKRGDELIIKSAGAYGEVMVSEYNLRSRPEVYYKKDTSMATIASGEHILMN